MANCEYLHHADKDGNQTTGQDCGKCEKCGSEIVCGPFGHYCLKCEPFYAAKCGICGVPRYLCCC